VIKQGKRQDVAEMHLYDEEGQMVGHATGTFMVINNIQIPQSSLVNKG
jgi:acyl-coenzyme A thioesterase PaaI-like protein